MTPGAPLPSPSSAAPAEARPGHGLRVTALLAGILPAVLFPGTALATAEGGSDDASLAAIKEEVERLRAELERFDDRKAGLVDTLDRLSVERLLLEEEIRAFDLERLGAEAAVEESRESSLLLASRLEEQRARLAASLREAYKMGRLRHYRLVLEVKDPQEFGSAYRYISEWSRADAIRVEEFRRTAADLADEQRRLDERIAALEENRHAGEARRARLESNRTAKQGALQRLEDEREVGQEAFLELEEAAGRLESLVAGLPPGEQIPVDGRLVDLESLKGHLPWPAAGPITLPFGTVEHPRFRTLTPHPGIDLGVPEGTPIHPVFGGSVVYADWFRGYGRTVIVDHGGGIVSIYAHLRSLEVGAGDVVAPDVSLGPSGSTGSLRGAVLYLEVRRNGEPEDPADWLRPRP